MVCHGEQEAFIILRHTVEMLKDLHKKIVVEGVETQEMVDILTEMHCDYLQGYLYSKPLPEGNYIAFLQRYLWLPNQNSNDLH